jgi:hypothetical protein
MHEGKVHTRTTTLKTRDREVEGGGAGGEEIKKCRDAVQTHNPTVSIREARGNNKTRENEIEDRDR